MTINGPAPILLAMLVAAAKRRFGSRVVAKLRGTVQAESSRKSRRKTKPFFRSTPRCGFLTDMVEFTTQQMPRWYPISISGYHIAEAARRRCSRRHSRSRTASPTWNCSARAVWT